ncbi:ADP-ribosyl cyclase/cyclic ADP-ribose hydrolase 1 [Cynocephalus volans]|uniref:ADP-ribosyl cyclase/cyclic ADP-ribose hydrolase 1 n=1 Tax=Cynocephalus volans TaxID=110931 RepID=UPI002FCB68A4
MADNELSPVPGDKPCCPISKKTRICLGVSLLVVILAVVVAVGVLKWGQPHEHLRWNGTGTTDHLSEIVLGRCFLYTRIVQPELRDKDCQKIWDAFRNAFISKNPCNIREEDYQPLMKMANQTIPCNKTLLWSKTNELAHQYTRVQQDMFTLEDTLLGYIADNLMWCGDASSSEMNYQSCPHWKKDCSNNPNSVFWKMVSQRFAEAACGVVQVMLNGSISKTFNKDSIFGSLEIFKLQPEKVHTLQAWVMHTIEGVASDSCSSSSINELKLILSQKNITFICQNDYRPARFVQCVKNPEHLRCRSII